MINLIDSEGHFNPKLDQFPSVQANIAIFGSQSSGKSTLLNHAFGTNFPTLNTLKTRQQCTKGVWFYHLEKFNIIDTQGFDSIERAKESRIYERQIALFSLAIADVIMINIWMNQIGRYDGGQISILKIILKAARHLIKSQSRTIIFVIKDCTDDADKSILQQQLDSRVKQLIRESENNDKTASIKFNIEYFFMSHFVHHFDKYAKQAKQLPFRIKVRKSQLQHYEPRDRLIYLTHIWETICTNDDIDLRVEEEALRTFIVNRIRKQIKDQIDGQIKEVEMLGQNMSYQRFYERYVKKSFALIKQKLPKFLDEKLIKPQFFILEQELEYTIHNHFNDVILPNEEMMILRETLDKQLRKSYKSVQLEKVIIQQRKKSLDLYKALVKGHKEAQIMIKSFAEKITESSVQYETQVSHLFNQFQNKLELAINKELDEQVNNLNFEKDKISKKVKELCKEYGYNEWQLTLTEIWEKSSHRILTQKLGEKIERASSRLYFSIWSGNKEAEIIGFHKRLEKECEIFITNLLIFFDQDDTGIQYFEKAKQKIKNSLQKCLIREKKRYRLTLLVLGIFLIFFYSEFVSLLKMGHIKKRNRRYLTNGYIFIVIVLVIVEILKRRS